ncbi:hypothetical protein [Paenibacillus camerounensis]|uniref:hypothetical protein n=1 Tax=Paenibacillus camerounensis TaxID=1243663 RepID=UPI0005AAF221|nr:hypothetical protein [Paenibacillus camerounensis]
MEQAKRMLLMNLTVSSLILSILYAVIITNSNNSLVSGTPYASGPGDAVVFVLFFLMLYMCHMVLSLLQYFIFRNAVWRLSVKMIVFNGAVAAMIIILYVSLNELIILFLLLTPVVFSIRAAI